MGPSLNLEDWQYRVPKNQKILRRNGGSYGRRICHPAGFDRGSYYRIDTSGWRRCRGLLGIEPGQYSTGARQLRSVHKEHNESKAKHNPVR